MSSARSVIVSRGHPAPYDFSTRTEILDDALAIYGWPSRGGVIILNDAEAMDFEHLGMNPLAPQEHRFENQEEEDTFCQRLLLLGAKWWDSLERAFYIGCYKSSILNNCDVAGHMDGSFRNVDRPEPTVRETCWVKVGWPSSGGGLWVSEFEETWGTFENEDNLPPQDVELGRVRLARTMDERCDILEHRLHGRFYTDVSEYKGHAFLTAWTWKRDGEVGRLITPDETVQEWRNSYT